MPFCEICGGYYICEKDEHTCLPLWEVAIEEDGDEPYWSSVYASLPEIAAEKYADENDCVGDYTIVSAGDSGTTVVLVRRAIPGASVRRFHVIGEAVPQYTVRELEEGETP